MKTGKGGNCDALQLEAAHVAPVVLGFNYEANNAPAYKFRNLCDPQRTHRPLIKFQGNRTNRGGVIAM